MTEGILKISIAACGNQKDYFSSLENISLRQVFPRKCFFAEHEAWGSFGNDSKHLKDQ